MRLSPTTTLVHGYANPLIMLMLAKLMESPKALKRLCYGHIHATRSSGTLLNRTQYPSDVIALVVLWRLRYKLSLRDLPEMFAVRGIVFSYEAVREWEAKLTPALAEDLRRRRRGQVGRSWYVDETYLKVHGRWCYLYRAIDRNGNLVDVLFSEHRDMAAAQ